MKKILAILVSFIFITTIISCRSVYRDYQDDELEMMALTHFDLDSYETFKIIDVDTARYLTTKDYQNSGVIIGIKNDEYIMIFVPRRISEEPYILQNAPYFNLLEIYLQLENYIEESMFLEDYGGLSIAVYPYADIKEEHPSLNFDSQVFFIVTTDEDTYYANYINESLVIFDTEYSLIFS